MEMHGPWRGRWLAVGALALSAAACYSPSIIDCSIVCGDGAACPSGSTCGLDGLCHTGAIDRCGGGGETDAPGGGGPDARRFDAPIGQPDAPGGRPDAPPPPPADAPPPPPDAPDCTGAGEPDDVCPGETVGPVPEGKHITVGDRRIYPAGDVDVFRVPVLLNPIASCPSSGSVAYALRITLAPPPGTDLRLRRTNRDRVCGQLGDNAGTSVCIPFVVSCTGPQTVEPLIFFGVAGNGGGTASCTPYGLTIQSCAAGSTCDNCKTL